MEQLLHYTWKHRLFPTEGLRTVSGKEVEVVDSGLANSNAGPDFFNAKVKIDGTLWVGNVEIHDRAADWFAHRHDTDSAYDNVVLHVVGCSDCIATDSRGKAVEQAVLQVPQHIRDNYRELLSTDAYPPCYRIVPDLPRLTVRSWMSRLQTERLEQKAGRIAGYALRNGGAWEDAFFTALARTFGFGVNGEMFEQWAEHLPLASVAKHRDDIFQVEAMFMGTAGLLDESCCRGDSADAYFRSLQKEYAYLARKFGLTAIGSSGWRFMRMRPQNFPYLRLSQLATLYHERRCGLGSLLDCGSADDIRRLLQTRPGEYWQTHYTFGRESLRRGKSLSKASLDLLVINTAVPVMFAYGRHSGREELCQRAADILESLRAEQNGIVRMWQEVGLTVENAGDSQALIQLKKQYCDRKDCLRCRFGYEYLKNNRQ